MKLTDEEKIEAETDLIKTLAPNDHYTVQALGYLRSKAAFEPLLKLLSIADLYQQVFIAEALWQIDKYQGSITILKDIVNSPSVYHENRDLTRMYATSALGSINDPKSIEILKSLLDDKEYLVKYHAHEGLKRLLNLET